MIHRVFALKTINTSQFGEYKVFFKVYEKDFSLPTEKEKQRNWDLFLVSNFSPGQPLFPTYFEKGSQIYYWNFS